MRSLPNQPPASGPNALGLTDLTIFDVVLEPMQYIFVGVVVVLTGTRGLIGVMCLFAMYRWHLQSKNLLLSQGGPGKVDFTQGARPSGYNGGGGGGGGFGYGGGGGGGGAGGRMTGFPAASSPAATRNNRPASRGPGGNIRTLFDR
eukprot:g70236.t1